MVHLRVLIATAVHNLHHVNFSVCFELVSYVVTTAIPCILISTVIRGHKLRLNQ